MSLDGHIFRSSEIYPLLSRLSFTNPNTMESVLSNNVLSLPKMICYEQSKIVNIPANKVQNTYANRYSEMITVFELNQRFLQGDRLSLKPILNIQNTSVHQEIPLLFFCPSRLSLIPNIAIIINCQEYNNIALYMSTRNHLKSI